MKGTLLRCLLVETWLVLGFIALASVVIYRQVYIAKVKKRLLAAFKGATCVVVSWTMATKEELPRPVRIYVIDRKAVLPEICAPLDIEHCSLSDLQPSFVEVIIAKNSVEPQRGRGFPEACIKSHSAKLVESNESFVWVYVPTWINPTRLRDLGLLPINVSYTIDE